MIELRRALHPHLRSVHPRVYFQRAPDTAQFPYLTYGFEAIPDGEGFELIVLDIDGWDMSGDGDTTGLETLMADVNRVMNKTTLTADDLVVSFYLDRQLALEDENPQIIRRKYVYQGRLFERGDK